MCTYLYLFVQSFYLQHEARAIGKLKPDEGMGWLDDMAEVCYSQPVVCHVSLDAM